MDQFEIYDTPYQINSKTACLYPEALFIIELEHRSVGSVWFAEDKQDFIDKLSKTFEHDSEAPEANDFDDWVEFASHDLRSMPMLNLNEAIEWVLSGSQGSFKLLKVLDLCGFVEYPEEECDGNKYLENS